MSPNCKMGYKDPRTAELVQFLKGKVGIKGLPIWSEFLKKGSKDGQIGPIFKEKVGIQGPPIWSEFYKRDPRTAKSSIESVRIEKGIQWSTDGWIGPNFKKKGPRTAEWVQIFKRKSRNPPTADFVGIFKRMTGSTDGRFGPNFSRGWRDLRTADLIRIFKKGSTDGRIGPKGMVAPELYF